MKLCLGQINTTPGDFAGNMVAIKEGIDRADRADCDLIVFPELSIPGYLSQDLIYHAEFIDRNLSAVDELIDYSRGCSQKLHIVVGCIERNPGIGKPFFNTAIVVKNGSIEGRYKKQLLPFYDVFDELRYFEPGNELLLFNIADKRIGITICEDLWNDKGSDDYNYSDNPMQQYREAGADIIVSLNSSPYIQDKPWQRLSAIAPGTQQDLTVVYVNQIGGQDELVFDGQSFVVSNGDLIHLSNKVDKNSYEVVDLEEATPLLKSVHLPTRRSEVLKKSARLIDLLVLCLKDYVEKSGFQEIVLASSGGVDSAVVCELACEAIGARNVHAIRMPSIHSSDHSREDAIELHENLGCWDYEVKIGHEPLIEMLNQSFLSYPDNSNNLVTKKMQSGYADVADENIQARMRDLYVMHFSNAFGAMPVSTGNKTESACGYYTHFDMNFSFAPIKDLYKYQVIDIARSCPEIPPNIWKKPPSAELAEGQIDEDSLLSYAILDPIVRAYIEDYVSKFEEFADWVSDNIKVQNEISSDITTLEKWFDSDAAKNEFYRIISLIGKMEFKRRQTCPGPKVSKVAFGIGRRIPIVEKWS